MRSHQVVLVAILAILGTVGCSDGPATKQAKEVAAKYSDERIANSIRAAAGPQIIRCDVGTPNLQFFDTTAQKEYNGELAEALIFYRYDQDANWYTCYDRSGFDSLTGEKLRKVTKDIVLQVLQQPAPPSQRRAVVPVLPPPTIVIQTEPQIIVVRPEDRQLGEGPCCRP